MGKDTINPDQELGNENIFEDFATDEGLGKEVESMEKDQKKDTFFYMNIALSTLKVSNTLLFLGIGMVLIYMYIQNETSPRKYSLFTPVCSLFLGEVGKDINTCYSLGYYSKDVGKRLENEKKKQAQDVAAIIGDIYLVDNFIYSEVVSFLINTSKTSLQPIEILSHFDVLKNKFEPIDKSMISCKNITIREPGILEAHCEAYSSDWNTNISEVEEGSLSRSQKGGTSISIASSFIDFIEKSSDSLFTIIDKQKVFLTTNVSGKGTYTKRTPFVIKLRYTSSQDIEF